MHQLPINNPIVMDQSHSWCSPSPSPSLEPTHPTYISSTPIPVPISSAFSSKASGPSQLFSPRSTLTNTNMTMAPPPVPQTPQFIPPPNIMPPSAMYSMMAPVPLPDVSGKKGAGIEGTNSKKGIVGKKKRKVDEGKETRGSSVGELNGTIGGFEEVAFGVPMSMGVMVQAQVSVTSDMALDGAGVNSAGMKWGDLSVEDRDYWFKFQKLMAVYNLNPENPADYLVAKSYLGMAMGYL